MDNSAFAIGYLYSFNILDIIVLIKDYDAKNNYDKTFLKMTNIYILGEYLLSKNKKEKILDIEINSDNFNKVDFSLLLLTLYFRDIKCSNSTINQLILKNSYKAGNDYLKPNYLMWSNFNDLFDVLNEETYERLKIGKVLRKITSKNIIPTLFACIAYEYIEKMKLNSVLFEIDENTLKNIIDKAKNFFVYILNEDMFHIDKMKPLFNGKEILDLLKMKAGKEVGVLLDYLIEEQIKDPKLDKDRMITKKYFAKKGCLNNNGGRMTTRIFIFLSYIF